MTAGRPRLLDLFCKAGGASRGYHMAGFHVTGVDIEPQPRHAGDAFIQADALEYLAKHGQEYDAIHASPPCQGYSIMNNLPWLRDKEYPLLILPTRELLNTIGKPYILENVMGARYGSKSLRKRGLEAHGMQAGFLCGLMFGLPFYRHRLFESNVFWLQPSHPRHRAVIRPGCPSGDRAAVAVHNGAKKASLAAKQQGGNGAQQAACGVGHAKGWRDFAAAIGCEWMTRDEVTQAIPPAYTAYLGGALLRELERRR